MAESLGRVAEIYVDTGGGYNKIGAVTNVVFTVNQALHDITDNDDGIFKANLRGHINATLDFDCNYDEADTAQENMLAAIIDGNATSWKVMPQGDDVGNIQYLFSGDYVSQEVNMPTQGPEELMVTVETTGTITREVIPAP